MNIWLLRVMILSGIATLAVLLWAQLQGPAVPQAGAGGQGHAVTTGATRSDVQQASLRELAMPATPGAVRTLAVQTSRGTAISGATATSAAGVRLGTSDQRGHLVLSDLRAAIVACEGYAPVVLEPRESASAEVETVVLSRTVTLECEVTDVWGAPLDGATITVRPDHGVVQTPGSRAVDGLESKATGDRRRSATSSDGRVAFHGVYPGRVLIGAHLEGYVQRAPDAGGHGVYLPVPIDLLQEGGDVVVRVSMAPLLVGVVCGIPAVAQEAGYADQFVAVGWQAPRGMEVLQAYSEVQRSIHKQVTQKMRTRCPSGSVQLLCVVATERASEDPIQAAEVAIAVAGRPGVAEAVAFVRTADWSEDQCTMFVISDLPEACQVLVRSRHMPGLVSADGLLGFGPVESWGGSHRFLVPEGEYQLVPSWGLFRQRDHVQRLVALQGKIVEAVPNWGLATIEIEVQRPKDSFVSVVVRGGGGMMRLAPDQLPAEIVVMAGEYRIETVGNTVDVIDEQVVTVAAGSSTAVLVR